MADNTVLEKHTAGPAESTSTMDNASLQASQALYAETGAKVCDARALNGAINSSGQNTELEGFSAIPPYLLYEIGRRSGNAAYTEAGRLAESMQVTTPSFRPHDETTSDFHGAREVYDAKGKFHLPGQKARFEGEKPTGDTEVDKVYEYTGIVRDFYAREYNRNSIDGNGMKFISSINFRRDPSIPFENAFWDGNQMAYGRPEKDSPFKTFVLLDVTGHEITHGVSAKEVVEAYYGQSGALKESISDVFGELIEQYANKQTADQADWLIGDGAFKKGVNDRGLRDMLNPGTAYDDPRLGKDPQPSDMANYKKTSGDHGGIHTNSSIPSRAFALFARAVGGYAWEDPGHIWFAARKAAGNNPSFATFAYQTIEAAKALGKPDEVEKLQKAWETVQVVPSATEPDTLTPAVEVTQKKPDNSG